MPLPFVLRHILSRGDKYMQPCEFMMFVSSLACCIAKDRSPEEIGLLSAIFSQLSGSLGTILAQQELCCNKDEDKDKADSDSCEKS